MSQNSKNGQNGFGAILLRVDKDRIRKLEQCKTSVRANTTYIAVNANAHGRKTRPGMSEL